MAVCTCTRLGRSDVLDPKTGGDWLKGLFHDSTKSVSQVVDIGLILQAGCEVVNDSLTLTNATAVIFNCTDLDYMNSGGIGLLVTTLIRAQRNSHALRAYGLTEHYQQILALTRLDEAISIYTDEAAAIAG